MILVIIILSIIRYSHNFHTVKILYVLVILVDYKKLESEFKSIIDLVEKLPEKYREKTYGVLLTKLLDEKTDNVQSEGERGPSLIIPVEVKGLLKKHAISEKSLEKIFFIENRQVVPIYELPTDRKATSQIQLSLLIALENSLNERSGKLEFSIENIRLGCKDRKCFDPKNFNVNFKNNKNFFGTLDDPEHVILSKDGKDELAKTILELIKT